MAERVVEFLQIVNKWGGVRCVCSMDMHGIRLRVPCQRHCAAQQKGLLAQGPLGRLGVVVQINCRFMNFPLFSF